MAGRAEALRRFKALDICGRRAQLTVEDERIVTRVYSYVSHLGSLAQLCADTNLPGGLSDLEEPGAPVFDGHLFDLFGFHWLFGQTDVANVVCVRSDLPPVMRPKLCTVEDPERFFGCIERVLPDFLASPNRPLRPQAMWWRLLSKEPTSWASLDRSLALLLEQRLLFMLEEQAAPEAAVDFEKALVKAEKKKAKRKAKKKKQKKAESDLDDEQFDAEDEADVDDVDDLKDEDKPASLSTVSTRPETPRRKSQTAASSPEGPVGEDVSASQLVSMVWSGLSQDRGGWAQVTKKKSRQKFGARGDAESSVTASSEQDTSRSEQDASRSEQDASRSEQDTSRSEQDACRSEQDASRSTEQTRDRGDRCVTWDWVPYEDEVEYTNVPPMWELPDELPQDFPEDLRAKLPDGSLPEETGFPEIADYTVEHPDTDEELYYGRWY
jgi:hypothetical protein